MRVGMSISCEIPELLFNFSGVGGGGGGGPSSPSSAAVAPAAKKKVGPQQSLRFDIEPKNSSSASASVQGFPLHLSQFEIMARMTLKRPFSALKQPFSNTSN